MPKSQPGDKDFHVLTTVDHWNVKQFSVNPLMVGPKKALQHEPKGVKLNKRNETKAQTKCANRGIGTWSVWVLWARLQQG